MQAYRRRRSRGRRKSRGVRIDQRRSRKGYIELERKAGKRLRRKRKRIRD